MRIGSRLVGNIKRLFKQLITTTTCFFLLLSVNAQATPSPEPSVPTAVEETSPPINRPVKRNIFSFSIEELLSMDVTLITSASKFPEQVVDAPMSASVVTAREIRESGATSIPEVLRLIPGVLVLQESPGNYKVYARGFANLPPSQFLPEANSKQTLVMIDGRPVYNYYNGGVNWESLPIDLHDIGRIEVIRGPASALYGANAVNGVINIFTRTAHEKGLQVKASLTGGTGGTELARVTIDYVSNDIINATLSAYHHQRDRNQSGYWSDISKRNETAETIPWRSTGAPNPDRFREFVNPDNSPASERKGINAAVRAQPTDAIAFDIAAGYQESRATKVEISNGFSPLMLVEDESWYLNVRGSGHGLSGQFSYAENEHSTFYDKNTLVNATLEYEFIRKTQHGELHIRPGVSYLQAEYDGGSIPNGSQMENSSAYLRAEQRIDSVRLVGAFRWDKYNHPDKGIPSGNLGIIYSMSPEHHLRFNYGRAHRSPFVDNTFLFLDFGGGSLFLGNKELDLVQIDSFELGYREQLSKSVAIDVTVFNSFTKNYSAFAPRHEGGAQLQNVDMRAEQLGTTTSVTWKPSDELTLRVFGTLQRTRLKDLDESLRSETDKFMPSFFGGFWANYRPSPKAYLNVSGNMWSSRSHVYIRGEEKLPSRAIFNFSFGYHFNESSTGFISLRDTAVNQEREYLGGDIVKPTLFIGARFKW